MSSIVSTQLFQNAEYGGRALNFTGRYKKNLEVVNVLIIFFSLKVIELKRVKLSD